MVLRRVAAAGCLLLAGWVVVADRQEAHSSVLVVVATRDVVAGDVVSDDDVGLRHRATESAPDGALTRPATVVGRRATVAITTGEILTPARVVGAGLLTGLPAGFVAVPVPVSDTAALTFVHPGDRVDLYPGGSGAPVARGVLVLEANAPRDSTGLASPSRGATLVVAAPDEIAGRILAAVDPAGPAPGYSFVIRSSSDPSQ